MPDISSTNTTGSARAANLLESWERLSYTHASLGSGCACGIGGVTLTLGDFEQDIVDYVRAEAEKHRRSDILDFIDTCSTHSDTWSIERLLGALAAGDGSDYSEFILDRLSRTLESFEKLHGGR